MGAGLGFVRDAQNAARQNRNNLKNKSTFQRTYKNKTPKIELNFKESTPEELEQFRIEYLKEKRTRTRKHAIRMVIIFAALTLIIWQLFF
ncbi:MAG: hypothetical protein GY816_01650 [Cytophagales bacterium]|nr:hypothetical protein [Cytophagales bacterium]